MTRVITITSGKGGVGKTSISLNLSLALSMSGFRVCLFDADLGLANINILTGIFPEENIEAVIERRLRLEDIVIKNYQGIDIIPGSSGIERLADLNVAEARMLINAFLEFNDYDFFVFDTSAGISSQVMAFCLASNEIITVITPEPTSLTDAYSFLKLLSRKGHSHTVYIIINNVVRQTAAQNMYKHFKNTVSRFLPLHIRFIGYVARDSSVSRAVVSQTPFLLLFPDAAASKCIKMIAKRLIDSGSEKTIKPFHEFWKQFITIISNEGENDNRQKPSPGIAGKNTGGDAAIIHYLDKIDSRLSALSDQVAFLASIIRPLPDSPEPSGSMPRKIRLDFEEWVISKNK